MLFFHGVHIPYVATPGGFLRRVVTPRSTAIPIATHGPTRLAESRAQYAAVGMDENQQDYWGTVTQIDRAVGRVRSLL